MKYKNIDLWSLLLKQFKARYLSRNIHKIKIIKLIKYLVRL
jgi:hypothetical protein